MLKLLQKEFILESSWIQSERMGTVNHMKDLYDAARHLVWLTQFGLSVDKLDRLFTFVLSKI